MLPAALAGGNVQGGAQLYRWSILMSRRYAVPLAARGTQAAARHLSPGAVMPTSEIFEIFGGASIAIVAECPGRSFPAMLIQGDTLRSILEEVDELKADAITENLEGA